MFVRYDEHEVFPVYSLKIVRGSTDNFCLLDLPEDLVNKFIKTQKLFFELNNEIQKEIYRIEKEEYEKEEEEKRKMKKRMEIEKQKQKAIRNKKKRENYKKKYGNNT